MAPMARGRVDAPHLDVHSRYACLCLVSRLPISADSTLHSAFCILQSAFVDLRSCAWQESQPPSTLVSPVVETHRLHCQNTERNPQCSLDTTSEEGWWYLTKVIKRRQLTRKTPSCIIFPSVARACVLVQSTLPFPSNLDKKGDAHHSFAAPC